MAFIPISPFRQRSCNTSNNVVNNNLIVASREDIFKQLLSATEAEPKIEVIDSVVIEEKEDK